LALHGVIKPKKFYLFGKPIAQSRSPALHNALFQSTGLPHEYELFETDTAQDVKDVLESGTFGGASVTIPLKLDVMSYLDRVSEDARLIGAVNTIVVDHSQKKKCLGPQLIGLNTDWRGMILVLSNAGAEYHQGQSGMVIGGGGTARAAIYALHQMGYSPIYIVGRNASKITNVIQSFPQQYALKMLSIPTDLTSDIKPPSVAIGTIPADMPIDETVQSILEKILPHSNDGSKTLLEMAYKPKETALMKLAEKSGWSSVPGLEVLAGQGYYQFESWTGIRPLYRDVKNAVMATNT